MVIHDGLVHTVCRILGVFYADDDLLGSRDPEWIQRSLIVLIGLFLWILLMKNVAMVKTIKCRPGSIWKVILEEVVGQRSKEKVTNYLESYMEITI